jgi:hypothetical protein
MKCNLCNKPIELVPSAAERAAKFGGKPEDYTSAFTQHSACALKHRADETRKLMGRTNMQTHRVCGVTVVTYSGTGAGYYVMVKGVPTPRNELSAEQRAAVQAYLEEHHPELGQL